MTHSSPPLRLLLADDHQLVRAGIRSLIEQIRDVEVVAEAENGRQVLELIPKHHPDIILIDIAMPVLNGLETVARVKKDFPELKVIMLSMHANEEYVLQSLKAGASGYMLKDATPNELELAIRSVAKGGTYLTPAVSKHVIDGYMKRTKINREEIKTKESVFERITPRQREILQLIAEGNSTKQIAQKLNLSVKTVESHRKQLMERLDIHDVAGLVRYAIRMGLVSPER